MGSRRIYITEHSVRVLAELPRWGIVSYWLSCWSPMGVHLEKSGTIDRLFDARLRFAQLIDFRSTTGVTAEEESFSHVCPLRGTLVFLLEASCHASRTDDDKLDHEAMNPWRGFDVTVSRGALYRERVCSLAGRCKEIARTPAKTSRGSDHRRNTREISGSPGEWDGGKPSPFRHLWPSARSQTPRSRLDSVGHPSNSTFHLQSSSTAEPQRY